MNKKIYFINYIKSFVNVITYWKKDLNAFDDCDYDDFLTAKISQISFHFKDGFSFILFNEGEILSKYNDPISIKIINNFKIYERKRRFKLLKSL